MRLAWLAAYCALACAASCAREIKESPQGPGDGGKSADGAAHVGQPGADGGFDGGKFGNADPSSLKPITDASFIALDASATVDAFFINDPPPPMCGQDGQMLPAEPPGGSPECPNDKNREGCPCPKAGVQAACWPGKRVHRNHGICKDGVTTCVETLEFGLRWGSCEGYVLPDPEATAGPAACGCFSSGTWNLTNLSPCILAGSNGTYLYSSKLKPDGGIDCGTNVPEPPPAPSGSWSQDTLNVDCGGQFKLCFTIKAGDVSAPKADDCVIAQSCVDTWYPDAGTTQMLPDLPSWSSPDTACAAKFVQSGGYGEMSVIGKSAECDVVDDGHGNPYVFHRIDYCPPSCQQNPSAPECQGCATGGSGMFN